MKITRNQLRLIIEHALYESAEETQMHRCFDNRLVPFGSQECIDDISVRMEDAKQTRDECDNRSDSRVHYNGILNDYRRKLRAAQRIMGMTSLSDDILDET